MNIDLVFTDMDGNDLKPEINEVSEPISKEIILDNNKIGLLNKETLLNKDKLSNDNSNNSDLTPNLLDMVELAPQIQKFEPLRELQLSYRVNDLPKDLLSKDLEIGNIYISFDLNVFFTSVKDLEKYLLQEYEKLDKKEIEMRSNKIKYLENEIMKFKIDCTEKLNKIEEQELDLKKQVARLSNILINCENIKKKNIEKNNNSENETKLNDLILTSRRNIDELNLKLYKLRDHASNTFMISIKKLEYLLLKN
jgi:hypothetical protein